MKRCCPTTKLASAVTSHWLWHSQHAQMIQGLLSKRDLEALVTCHAAMKAFKTYANMRLDGMWDDESTEDHKLVTFANLMLNNEGDLRSLAHVTRLELRAWEALEVKLPANLTQLSMTGWCDAASLPPGVVDLDVYGNSVGDALLNDIESNRRLRSLKIGTWETTRTLPPKLARLTFKPSENLANYRLPKSLVDLTLMDCPGRVSLNPLPPHLRTLTVHATRGRESLELPQSLEELYLALLSKIAPFETLPPSLKVLRFNAAKVLPSLPNNIETLIIDTAPDLVDVDLELAEKCPNVKTLRVVAEFACNNPRKQPRSLSAFLASLPLAQVETLEISAIRCREVVATDFLARAPNLRNLKFRTALHGTLDLSRCSKLTHVLTSMNALLDVIPPPNGLQHVEVFALSADVNETLAKLTMPQKSLTILVPCAHDPYVYDSTDIDTALLPRTLASLHIRAACECHMKGSVPTRNIHYGGKPTSHLILSPSDVCNPKTLTLFR